MEHKGTKVLETERLILRPFTMADAPTMFRNWANDPEVTKYISWSTHRDVEDTGMFIANVLEGYEKPDKYEWAIVLKSLGEPVGSIGVVTINEAAKCMHLGYVIGRRWWHQGITSEAFKEVIRYLMEEIGVNRIDARFNSKNPNSGKVMEKCGLRHEGTLRQAATDEYGYCDMIWYGLLREEYDSMKK